MSEESKRIISLDEEPAVPVTIKGRSFQITEQRRAILERVMENIYREEAEPLTDDATDKEVAFRNLQRWGDSREIFALILGSEPDSPDFKETVQYLEDNLSWPRARAIFEEWWNLNDVNSFFERGGNPLVYRPNIDWLKELPAEDRRWYLEKLLEKQITESKEAPETTESESPAS